MKTMGIVLTIAGSLIAAYVGSYLCLYEGFSQLIKGSQVIPIDLSAIAQGAARIALAPVVALVLPRDSRITRRIPRALYRIIMSSASAQVESTR